VIEISNAVVGDVSVASKGTLNAVGISNDRGNRVDVFFRRIVFTLDGAFNGRIRIHPPNGRTIAVLVPNQAVGTAQPANDVTYLDRDVRVVRGGDGALFVFHRDEGGGRPMLTMEERDALFNDKQTMDVVTGTGRTEDAAPPGLLKLLFRGR